MPEITLELIITPDAGELFVPSIERVKKAEKRAKTRIETLRKEAAQLDAAIANPPKGIDPDELKPERDEKLAEAAAIELDMAATIKANTKIRENYAASITSVKYPFRPYTDGEKSDALAEATDYSGSAPKTDYHKYHRLLVSACTGISMSELRALSPGRADALIKEVIDRSEPDPARLDFLF